MKSKKILALAVFVLLAVLYRCSRSSSYGNWGNGEEIKRVPFTGNNSIKGCTGCVWGDGNGGGNQDVITCADCGGRVSSKVFAPNCTSIKSLHTRYKLLTC